MRRVFIGAGKTLGSAQIYYWLLRTPVGFAAPRSFHFYSVARLIPSSGGGRRASPGGSQLLTLGQKDDVGESTSNFVVALMNAAPWATSPAQWRHLVDAHT